MAYFKVFRGTVVSIFDKSKSCLIKAVFPEYSPNVVDVVYTTPYYSYNNGGMLAVPEEGSNILASFSDFDNKFYYMSTIIESLDGSDDIVKSGGIKDWEVIGDRRLYSERDRPQKVSYCNQAGAGLDITRKFLPDYIVSKVDLNSENGKKISLNDSPNSDSVIIRNEHGDGIIISGEQNDIHPDRGIELKSVGPHKFVVFQSDMTMMVVDGRDINIENYSTGAQANQLSEKYGNISIRSKNKDVTLVTNGQSGNIFITTPRAKIQINSNGDILLSSDGTIQMDAPNITLNADSNVNIKGANVNIKSDANCAIEAGEIASVDGSQVQLNSGFTAQEAQIIPTTNNAYGE